MPPAPFCLPGPHDVHNAGSVKLAEATRIRLILPGLNLSSSSKAEASASSSKQSGKASGDAAAASAKAQKKLRKLQGIASQAEQAHSGIIVDEGVLDSEDDEADESSAVEGSSSRAVHRSSTGSSSSEQEKRKAPGRTAAASTAATGANAQEPAAKGSRPRPRNLAVAGKAGSSSRGPTSSDSIRAAAASSSPQGAADGNSGSANGPGSCSSSDSSSRRGSGDKPHVPIWERSLPSGPAEARRTAAAAAAGPKVLQTVALKTFSPTLGTFGLMLTEQDSGQQDGSAPSPSMRPPVLRSRSASRMPGGAPAIPAALRKHTTPPYNKLSAAATAGAAAAPPLGVELPSMLRHVNFSSGASAYTPSQLLEKLILR